MRLLLTTDTVGGVWDHTVTLARALHAAGAEVLIAAVGEPRDVRLARLPEGVQYTAREYRLEWMEGAERDLEPAARWLRSLCAAWRPDVLHLNQMAYPAFGMPVPTLVAVHSDVLGWWREVEGVEAPVERWGGYAGWVRAGLHAAGAVVTPTAFQAGLVRRHYGTPVSRVIPNGVERPAEAPAARSGFEVVTVGRAWDRAKGVDVLDAAAGLLAGEVPEIHLLGETRGPHGEQCAPGHLRAHGRVERAEVDAWLRRARVYVAPSRYEPFGLAPLEAAFAGCALVLSDIGSFRELWDGCAEFVPPGDPGALAGVIRRLRGDPRRVAALAAAARKRALRRYGAGRMAREYLEVYHALRTRPAERAPLQTRAVA